MRAFLVSIFCLLGIVLGSNCQANTDDFSSPLINGDKWNTKETGIEISNQKLLFSLRTPTPEDKTDELALRFRTSNPMDYNELQADLSLGVHPLQSGGELQDLSTQIVGFFYNSSTNTEDVVASIGLKRNDGNNTVVTIHAGVQYFMGDDIGDIDFTLTAAPGDVLTMNLHYNSMTNLFTFMAGPAATYPTGAETQTIQGPAGSSSPTVEFKGLLYETYNGGDATDIVTTATADNVEVDGSPYEDFDTPLYTGKPNVFFDPAKWYQDSSTLDSSLDFLRNDWVTRSIESNQLILSAQNQGLSDVRVNQTVSKASMSNFVQGDVTIDPTSFYSGSGGHSRVQLWVNIYNDTYDGSTSSPYNGEEGAVYPGIYIWVFSDGSTQAWADLSRGENVSGTTYSTVFNHAFACTVTLGSPNTFSIERIDKTFHFTCDDETVSHTVSTPMYEGEWGKFNNFRARVISSGMEYGYIKTHIDNVKLNNSGIMTLFPAILTATKQKQ